MCCRWSRSPGRDVSEGSADAEGRGVSDLVRYQRGSAGGLHELAAGDEAGDRQGDDQHGGGDGFGDGQCDSRSAGRCCIDAVYLAAHDKLRQEAGRKILVMLTDGGDQGSQETLKTAIEAAQKANAIVYVILIADRGFYGGLQLGYSGDAGHGEAGQRYGRPGDQRGQQRQASWRRRSSRSRMSCGRSTC